MTPLHLGNHDLTSFEKHIIDIVSVATMVGALAEFLPHVAAGFTILWTGIRIWETDTVQSIFGRPRKDKEKE